MCKFQEVKYNRRKAEIALLCERLIESLERIESKNVLIFLTFLKGTISRDEFGFR
jgi:hypothetical protein